MLVTAPLFLSYQRCNRRAFLDVYGDPSLKGAPSDFLLKLGQDSLAHQQSILAEHTWIQPSYRHGDWGAGAAATLDLMRQGVEQIHQGVLLVPDPSGAMLLGIPTLLTKQPGLSLLGDWLYVPTDIKFSRRAKLEYQIILTYHVQLLAQTQGAWPETAWLALRERGLYAVDLWQTLPRAQDLLAGLLRSLQTKTEPEVFISRNQCSLCSWFDHCYQVASAQKHLSLVPGVTANRYEVLRAQQLLTVEAIATTHPRKLEPLPGFGTEVAHRLVLQAQSLVLNQPLPLPGLRDFAKKHALPTAPVELYFDIEAEPGLNLAFLHGVFVVDRQTHTQTFYPLVAESPEAEAEAWQAFVEVVLRYPSAPIFHFCAYEAQTVQRLGKLYGTPQPTIKAILNRFVDLHLWMTEAVVLPIENYTLKLIARSLGFDWRNSDANGAQAIYWYAQWLETQDRSLLDAIIEYNEDDCRATYHVKNWLTTFVATQLSPELALNPLRPYPVDEGNDYAKPHYYLAQQISGEAIC
jgi:predicted RecB family nuclease